MIAEILGAYVPLWRRVRAGDLDAMVRAARTRARAPVPVADEHETAARLGSMVERTLRVLPTDSRCLITSLVVLRLLEHRAIEGRLVIGVRNTEGFDAHAWVEHDGTPVLRAGDFTRLTEF